MPSGPSNSSPSGSSKSLEALARLSAASWGMRVMSVLHQGQGRKPKGSQHV
jgi:hypothetical protein